jgi:indolepyruvate decarboxylase
MNNSEYTVSHYLLDRLKQLGVDHLFAVPGDYASPFLKTLDAFGPIERVANINELGVGYACDGYARCRGIAAANVQYGVGTLSIINCIAGAWVERLSVVLIGPSPSRKDRMVTRDQGVLFHHSTGNLEVNREAMKLVTAASVEVRDGVEAPALIDAALQAMLDAQRPIYIEVWQDAFSAPCRRPDGKLQARPQDCNQASLSSMLDAIMARLRQAELPVLWLGVEVQRQGLQDLAQSIVDHSGLLFSTTSLAKTVLSEDQRGFLGTFAGPASPELTRLVMDKSDCVCALGTIITDDYLDFMNAQYGSMIEVNDGQARIGYATYQQVPLADLMGGLLARLKSDSSFPRNDCLPEVSPESSDRPVADAQLSYENFYYVLADWLVGEGHCQRSKLILGESSSLYVFSNLFGLPRDGFIAQAAWGSLGHETGCALGIELGSGQRPIIVAGDGGFMMICQEVSSLVRQKSNAIIFVMSNGGYAIEQAFVDITAFSEAGQYAPFDLLPSWDYQALAKAFGAKGYAVTTVGQLQDVLGELALPTGQPALVEVKLSLKDLPPQLRRLAEPS